MGHPRTHGNAATQRARTGKRDEQIARSLSLSLSLSPRKYITLYSAVWLASAAIVRACGCADARASTLSCACTRIAPPRPRYSSVGYVRVNIRIHVETWCVDRRVRLHTTFLVYTGIWVSVFLESSFSSLDSAFPPRFSLIL